MKHELSYTVEEVANLLKVSKLTVYDLIKKGKIPAFKVGRQMRISAADIDLLINPQKKALGTQSPPSAAFESPTQTTNTKRKIIISGQDMVLDILGRHLERTGKYQALRSHEGSLNSLLAMYKGECDIVSLHMFDGDTEEYNVPFVRKILIGFPYTVINLVSRKAGLMVQKGNPYQLHHWNDLTKESIRLINREKGSGARILLEEQLRVNKIDSSAIKGYQTEETSHLSVASCISSGQADVGIGIEKAAKLVGLDFVPLIMERYDLVVINNQQNEELVKLLTKTLQTASFKEEIQSLSDYDTSQTGEVIFESPYVGSK
ncbi:putative molybdopterin biosynthesis protein [Evansella caseinilytica]|uniref:Putative molybdopterin biosynthesis protein n=1 Tax=Evansella caseinilytica TaxID=1503961 RepID=A0A1H3GC40_9BACI|nr:helix-turn-helix transcriptional regulator [Evansella caseinilytica]SDY00064.1 putative molybdopterin biosynthesis protein [Evansella caseinilytica]